MLKNYFKIALRNILKHKGYSFINISGLAIGIACFLLIVLYVKHELGYDRFHTKAERIYRVVEIIKGSEESSSAPFSLAPAMMQEYPVQVESVVRFFNFQAPTILLENGAEKRFNEKRLFFVDSTLFDVFDFELVKGDKATALAEPNSILLTESMAKKYLGDSEPLGKTLRLQGFQDYKVTGVLRDAPTNAHFQFDGFLSFSSLRQQFNGEPQGWYWNPCWTYVLLKDGVAQADFEAMMPAFVKKYFGADNSTRPIVADISLYLQPLTNIHLYSNIDYEIEVNSSISYVYIFTAIACFVLFIACINFMNLATARSESRAKEVGLRKVLGAMREQLIYQFLGESVLTTLFAVALAVVLAELSLPALEALSGKELALNFVTDWQLSLSLVVITIVVGVVSGLYPAFFLSSFAPATVLKGKFRVGRTDFTLLLRKSLITVQFAISMMLIIGTVVTNSQLAFLRTTQLGFSKEQVILIPALRTPVALRLDDVRAQLMQDPKVLSVTMTEDIPGSKYQTNTYRPEGYPQALQAKRLFVRDDFIKTMKMELVAGQDFNKDLRIDSVRARSSVIINEAMVKFVGWKSPEEAINKRFNQFTFFNGKDSVTTVTTVVGVVRDFNYASLHNPISPFVLDFQGSNLQFDRYLMIRIAPGDFPATLAAVEKVWKNFVPNSPMEHFFLDETLDELYRAEDRLSKVAGIFAAIAIVVACLGLFGLASFTAEQRRKEIGIRKVLGASVSGIVGLLSMDFLKLVLIANLIAYPLSYYVLNRWLEAFAFRVELPLWAFVFASVAALMIAFITVSYQAVKAAMQNPVLSLRYE